MVKELCPDLINKDVNVYISCIALIISWCICGWVVFQLLTNSKKIDAAIKNITLTIMFVRIISIPFRVVADIFCAMTNISTNLNSYTYYFRYTWFFLTIIVIFFIILLLTVRLELTFGQSSYAISKRMYYVLIILTILNVISIICQWIATIFDVEASYWFIILALISMVFFLIMSGITLYLFVSRMNKLTLQIVQTKRNLYSNSTGVPDASITISDTEKDNTQKNLAAYINTSKNSNAKGKSNDGHINISKVNRNSKRKSSINNMNKRQLRLLQVTSKYTLLSGITIVSTTMLVAFTCFAVLFPEKYPQSNIIIVIAHDMVLVDNIINVVCVSLQLPFASRLYHKFCDACDTKCKDMFAIHIGKTLKIRTLPVPAVSQEQHSVS